MASCDSPGKPEFFPGANPSPDGLKLLQRLVLIERGAFTPVAPRWDNLLPMGTLTAITVHHTGFPEPFLTDDFAATAEHLREIHTLHCDPAERNWADIGYHYAVDRLGRIWQLRDLRFQGAHVKNHNGRNAGIVLLGNFDLQTPTMPQTIALSSLLNFMRDAFRLVNVTTHQKLADTPTSCPGQHLQVFMDQNFRT